MDFKREICINSGGVGLKYLEKKKNISAIGQKMLSRPSVNSRNILARGALASKNLELTSGWKAHFLAYDGNS